MSKTKDTKKPKAKVAAKPTKDSGKKAKSAPEQAENLADTSNGKQRLAGPIPYTIHAQYIRDLSFENPNAFNSLRAINEAPPEININIGMDARRIQNDNIPFLYEVALNVRAEATRNQDTVFIAELQYGLSVSINQSVPENSHHPVLLIEVPRFAFPFARQIISTVTAQGGYPPLLMNPVDFHALYIQRFGQQAKEAQAN